MKGQSPSCKQSSPSAVTAYRTFEDLEACKAAREFRKEMYAVAKQLPDIEKFGLAGQMRRAALSLTNNIAEGHGRYHWLDQIKFTLQSRGSLEELLDDLNACEDEHYLPAIEIASLKEAGWRVHRIIAGYLRYLRERKQGESLALREDSRAYGVCEDNLDDLVEGAPASTLDPFNPSTRHQ
jgi:four helix bundle protein